MIPSGARAAVVLAVQNEAADPPLLAGEWLDEQGIAVEVVLAFEGQPVPATVPGHVSGVLCLGGPMGAHDDESAPWLADTRSLLRDAVDRSVPVLGLCLGSQLLAAATGGRVTLGPATEIGVVSVRRTIEGLLDPVTSQAVPVSGMDIPAAHWHQDNIVELPDGAVLLMTNDTCPVQVFRVADNAYGMQMHAEVDAAGFEAWINPADEVLARAGRSPEELSAEIRAAEHALIAAWRPAVRAWGDLVWTHAREASGHLATRA